MENETVKTNSLSIIRNVDDLGRVGKMLAMSNYFTDARDAAQASVKVMAGMEMGFGAFTSMTGIHIIQGKPSVGANLMASAVKSNPKYDYRVKEHTNSVCKIEFFEYCDGKKESIGVSEFTAQDARVAGVKNMDKYARNMLFARAMSNGIRWFCPDVFNGNATYTPEELGAEVDGEGNILKIEPVEEQVIEAEITPIPVPATEKSSSYPGDEAFLTNFSLPKNFMTDITVEDAEAVRASNGMTYGEMTLEDLYKASEAMKARLVRNHLNDSQKEELQNRITAIYLLFDTAKKQGGY